MARRMKITLLVAVLAAVLMLVAAVNLVLVFVLFSAYPPAGRPDTELTNFLAPMAVGALPFLVVGALVAWSVLQRSLTNLAVVSGIGLPFMVVLGFWAGLFASAQELPVGTPSAAALTTYQFTWLAALIADAVTLVMSLFSNLTRKPRLRSRPLR